MPAGAGGLWVDNAMIDERSADQPEADLIAAARAASGWNGLYFGGVAFKYQRQVGDLERAAQIASRYLEVVTTSGAGTGIPAEIDKLQRMKAALGATPLAVASGITPENVANYLPCVDCFLVATGISRSWTELDSDKLARLVKAISV
jgi:predicted TIM-barrel enzyme